MNPITPEIMSGFFQTLQGCYGEPEPARAAAIQAQVRRYGYLPYSYQRALRELSAADALAGLAEKFRQNQVFEQGQFCFTELSAVRRAGYRDARWLQREQHLLKLTNLLALGERQPGERARFEDWLKYLLVLPAGNLAAGVLATTVYFLPFQERDLGSAYIPHSSAVSPLLADQNLPGLDAEEQVRYFLAFCQLAGHPLMYDVLPQTGRFSRLVLAKPYLARWFDLAALNAALRQAIERIAAGWQPRLPNGVAAALTALELDRLNGLQRPAPIEVAPWLAPFQAKVLEVKRQLSVEMATAGPQAALQQRVREVVAQVEGWEMASEHAAESDIAQQGQIIERLLARELWTAPGGAWCSAGAPIYDGMSQGRAYPLFRHEDAAGQDVTYLANLDCLTPFYFAHWENGALNEPVVDFFLDYLQEWQARFNFDAFRFDHVDHIIDAVSVDQRRRPISYRIPAQVLGAVNRRMKAAVPHFGALAEYMLWDRLYDEYHHDMGFDLLWGDDMLRQADKDLLELSRDADSLRAYNAAGTNRLSILKTYNNQDGEFGLINQYPGQLTRAGALFKFLLLKFFPGGELAQRPVLIVDGDESFTPCGIAETIAAEITLRRAADETFFERFDALNRFALQHPALLDGQAELLVWEGRQHPVVWLASASQVPATEKLLVIANSQYPEWIGAQDGVFVHRIGNTMNGVEIWLPRGLQAQAEYVYDSSSRTFEPRQWDTPTPMLFFESLAPAEFHFYRVRQDEG